MYNTCINYYYHGIKTPIPFPCTFTIICDIYKPPSGTTEHLVDFTNKFTQWAAAINEK